MTGPAVLLRFRRRARHSARNRKERAVISPSGLPYLPASPVQAPPRSAPPEPVKPVQCGFCHVLGLSSEIPGIGGGEYRCSDIETCTQRWIGGARALPMPEPPLPVLPKHQEEAMATFMAAHDEENAREAEAAPETCPAGPEPGMTPNPSAPGGSSTGHHTANPREDQVSDRPGTPPAAEPGTEEEAGPAAEQDEAPAPVAEVSDPAPKDQSLTE